MRCFRVDAILEQIQGKQVLDVGCDEAAWSGYFARCQSLNDCGHEPPLSRVSDLLLKELIVQRMRRFAKFE